jgi:hypothetical protein
MQGAINGAFINRAIVNGTGWESSVTANLFATQADSTSSASATASLASVAPLLDGEDFLLGMTLTAVDAQAPRSMANHTLAAAVGASVGGGSSTVMDGHGTALDSAVAVAVALLGTQAANELLAEGKLDDLAAALTALQADHSLSATATVQLDAASVLSQAANEYAGNATTAVASMAELMDGDDTLAALVRMLLAHRFGAGLTQHGPGGRLTPHGQGSRLTVH